MEIPGENARDKAQLTSGYYLQLGLSPSVQNAGEHSASMITNSHSRGISLSYRRHTLQSPVSRMLFQPSFMCRE